MFPVNQVTPLLNSEYLWGSRERKGIGESTPVAALFLKWSHVTGVYDILFFICAFYSFLGGMKTFYFEHFSNIHFENLLPLNDYN